MRVVLVLLATTLLATVADADDRTGGKRAKPAPGGAQCIDVEVEGRHSYECLNAKLRADTGRVVAPPVAAPLDARSPGVKTGVVTIPAVQQQYGRNYGVSVMPYRPPRP